MSVQSINYNIAYMAVLFCFCMGFLCAGAPLFGWSYYSMEGALTSCSVEWADRSINVVSYNMFIFVATFLIPLIIIASTNLGLLRIVI